jgi:hypothetical protein
MRARHEEMLALAPAAPPPSRYWQRAAFMVVAAAICVGAGAAIARADWYGYSYANQKSCPSANVGISDVLLRSGHVAAWVGVSDPSADTWLQAGVEQSTSDPAPRAYVEWGRGGRQARFLLLAPATTAHVSLTKTGNGWYVSIAGRTFGPVKITHAQIKATGESWQPGGPPNTYASTILCKGD